MAADLKNRLENLGYSKLVLQTTDNDSIKKTQETKPDMVLMDIMLKVNNNGIDATHKIRDMYDIPFIYLTVSFDNKTFERAKITQPFGYILKPFENSGIHNVI